MDVRELDSFFDYQLTFEEDPVEILEDIVSQAKKYLPEDQIPEIYHAYYFTKAAHSGVKRLSGEPYIVHPLKATLFLMELKPDLASIQSCIMHDIIEDTEITREQIIQEFGQEVGEICEGLTKVSKVRYQWEDRHLETIKKTFLAMAKDLRVIFVKLADRIHNIQTLQFHPEERKRKKIAEETIKIYAPLAKRLWLYHFQLLLENGSFAVLHPEDFQSIVAQLKKYFWEGEKHTEKGVKMLTAMLYKEWMKNFSVKGRLKSPYRVYEKLSKKYQDTDITTVMDLLAFRVITQSVGDCYSVLWVVHKYYIPIIKKIKDYIAIPKFNGYKSIHTTVLGMFRFPVEIQIRTQEMENVAEYWVAAHFAYAESNAPTVISEQQWLWVQRLQKIVSDYVDAEQKEKFKSQLNIEVLDKTIFIYTPRGDIKELPVGSTVLDFAFSVHSSIGLRFKNAIVNWQIKPISYKLKTWDIVNINTFKNKYSATKHWMEFLRTPTAKSQLLKYIKTIERDVRLQEAIAGLNSYLKDCGLPLYASEKDKIIKSAELLEIEKRLLSILDKQDTYWNIVREVYPELWKTVEEKTVIKDIETEKSDLKSQIQVSESGFSSSDIVVDWDKHLHCFFCPECKPTPQTKIIAKSTQDGIKIHTTTCKALKTISLDSLMEAHRRSQEIVPYFLNLRVRFLPKDLSVMEFIQLFVQFNIQLTEMSIKHTESGLILVDFILELDNPAKASFLIKELKKYQSSLYVLKKQIS